MYHYINEETGELFAYDDEQVSAGIVHAGLIPCDPRPSPEYVWSGAWVLPEQTPPTLAELKAAIDAELVARLEAGVEWNGKLYHADYEFQSQITGMVGASTAGILPADSLVEIRRKDNKNELLSQDELKQLAGAVLAYVQEVYSWSWREKDQLAV